MHALSRRDGSCVETIRAREPVQTLEKYPLTSETETAQQLDLCTERCDGGYRLRAQPHGDVGRARANIEPAIVIGTVGTTGMMEGGPLATPAFDQSWAIAETSYARTHSKDLLRIEPPSYQLGHTKRAVERLDWC